MDQFLGVEREVLHPQRDPFADRGELRGLEMGVGEARQGAMLAGQLAERDQHRCEAPQQQPQPLAHDQEVGVVGDVGARGAEVQVGPGGRRLVAQRVDVGHHIVPQAFLVLHRPVEVDVVEVGAHLGGGIGRDREPELLFGFQQGEPEPAPLADAPALAP